MRPPVPAGRWYSGAGTLGPMKAVYVRDPDDNLIEFSTYDHGIQPRH
jgi:catechol 2,3-dioxygenase-like lactoylglutathione lyase family enzyme